MRVREDGTFEPLERLPMLFFGSTIQRLLAPEMQDQFAAACNEAIVTRRSVAFSTQDAGEVLINPILEEDGDDCRFLVCWARQSGRVNNGPNSIVWTDLRLDDIVVRYRMRIDHGTAVVEATPWWVLPGGEPHNLWPHHTHVSAMGLGHSVMESLIYDAAEAAAMFGGGPAVRFEVPSADMLTGLVPVFHAAIRAANLPPERFIVAVDVELAVDPDLLPVIVHLRTLGMKIDIVGLDSLTVALHTISDTSQQTIGVRDPRLPGFGPWADSMIEAASIAVPG